MKIFYSLFSQKLYQRQPRLYTTLGISYVQGACDTDTLEEKFYKVGLVKDNPGKYSGIRSMAHELGHL